MEVLVANEAESRSRLRVRQEKYSVDDGTILGIGDFLRQAGDYYETTN